MKRYKGAMTAGIENEIHGLGWFLENNQTDHILLFESPYLSFQFETQGELGKFGCIEGITRKDNVTFTIDKTERKLEALQLALVTWWEYGIVIVLKYRKNKICRLYGNQKLQWNLGMTYNIKDNEDLDKITLKTFKETFNNLVEQNTEKLSTISGVQYAQKIRSIALKWPKVREDMEPWRAKVNFKKECYIMEEDASKTKGFVSYKQKEGEENFLARSIINKMQTVKEKTESSNYVQITLTFSLSTVYYLLKEGAAFIDQKSIEWSRRREQMGNALDFAERVLKRLLEKAKGELKQGIDPSLKDEMGEHRKFDKLKGFLALLYVQLHGFCNIVKKDEVKKYRKEYNCTWDEADNKMREKGFHLEDNADRTADYTKDYFALMLKTPLRTVYEQSLSQRDKAILVLSRAGELISENLTGGEWDDEGYLLKKYLRFNDTFPKEGTQTGKVRKENDLSLVKRYIKYVLCPQEHSANEIKEVDPDAEKEYKKANDELEEVLKERSELQKNNNIEKKEKFKKINELNIKRRDKMKERDKAVQKMDLFWLKLYNPDFEINPSEYKTWPPNKARCMLLPGHQDAICWPDIAKVKEFVAGDRSGKKQIRTREVMRVAFEFRQLRLGTSGTFQKFYGKLVKLYEDAYNGYTKLLSQYEKRHPRDEKPVETKVEDKIRLIGPNAYTYECENNHISYRLGVCDKCGKLMMKSRPKPAKKSKPAKPGQKREELVSKDDKAPYKCDSGHTSYLGGTCQICGKLLKKTVKS